MSNRDPNLDRITALFLILHIVALFGGFLVLGTAFDFPDVLRTTAPERFAKFAENQTVIRPTYWVLTMTGITQILISVLLYHVLRAQSNPAALLSLVFGTLAGFCQALGFGRWVILIPYLAAEANDPNKAEVVAMLEGAFNHYAGMLIGEHIANICWGIWLASICLFLLTETNTSRTFTRIGLALASLLFLLAGEQIGVSGQVLGPLVDFGFPLLAVWHILLAVQLWRRNGDQAFSQIGRATWISAGALTIGMIAPALT